MHHQPTRLIVSLFLLATAATALPLNFLYHVETVDDSAKNNMLAI